MASRSSSSGKAKLGSYSEQFAPKPPTKSQESLGYAIMPVPVAKPVSHRQSVQSTMTTTRSGTVGTYTAPVQTSPVYHEDKDTETTRLLAQRNASAEAAVKETAAELQQSQAKLYRLQHDTAVRQEQRAEESYQRGLVAEHKAEKEAKKQRRREAYARAAAAVHSLAYPERPAPVATMSLPASKPKVSRRSGLSKRRRPLRVTESGVRRTKSDFEPFGSVADRWSKKHKRLSK